MKVREATTEDIPELVDMYIDLVTTAYPARRIAPSIIFYEIVVRWIAKNHRVMIVHNETDIAGFSYTSLNNAGGLTETILDAEITYVKPAFRKSKAAYLIYMDVFNYAVEKGMGCMSTSTPESSPIVSKRFGAEHTFNHFEIPTEYIQKLKNQHK